MRLSGKKRYFSIEEQSQILSNLGFEIDFLNPIKNPLREDNNPNCKLLIQGNEIILKDFGSDIFGNCLNIYSKWKNITKAEALKELNELLVGKEISKIKKPPLTTREKPIVSIKYKSSNEPELYQYFYDYHITYPTLRKFNVFIGKVVVVTCKINETFRHTKEEPCFLYFSGNNTKMYRPNSKKKWRTTASFIHGIEQIEKKHDLIVITKSLKDVMVLYELGIPAISCGSENTILNIDYLKKELGCDNFILFYDNDKAGKKAVKKYDLPAIFIPTEESKDISDYMKTNGVEATKQLMGELL